MKTDCKKCGLGFGSVRCFDKDCPNNTPKSNSVGLKDGKVIECVVNKETNMNENKTPKTQEDVNFFLQDITIKNAQNLLDIEKCLNDDGLELPNNVVINKSGIGSIDFIKWYEKSTYPTSYDECCNILNADDFVGHDLMFNFPKLINARNAYWKIAGEEMRLGKPWKYDMSKDEFSYAISYQYGYVQKNEIRYKNTILVFPTKEMRDTFYENFKELIEQCKELL